jgi:hypothetical protein
MGENVSSNKIFVKSLKGRLRHMWEDGIKTDLKQGMRMCSGLMGLSKWLSRFL